MSMSYRHPVIIITKELEKNQFSDVEKTTDGHLRQLKTNNIELEARYMICNHHALCFSLRVAHQSGHYDEGKFCLEE